VKRLAIIPFMHNVVCRYSIDLDSFCCFTSL
jgi:hypothetical protein